MTRQHLLIVGGGLAGLSTGCYALTNGWDVTILEHNLGLGGVCTAWSREDYTVDGCIHWLTGGPFQRLYEELHIVPPVEIRTLEEFFTYIDVATGVRITIGRDLERLAADLRTIAPEDGDAIDAILQGAREVAALQPPIDQPAELATMRSRLTSLWDMRHQLGTIVHFRKSVAAWSEENVRSGALRVLLPRLAPADAPMLLVLMILGYLARGWLSRPVGGTARFRDALIDRFYTLGGEARLHSTVEEIVVEEGHARGVRLTDGTIVRGNAVVSTASTPETVLRLLAGRYGAEAMRERLAQWKMFEPVVMVSYGVAAPLIDLPSTLLLEGLAPIEVGARASSHLYVRIFNEGPGFAPPGHAVVQTMLATDYDWWATRGTRYGAAKDAVANTVLAQLVEYIPSMRGAVRMIDVATPLTFWRSARSWRGAFEGWQPTGQSMMTHVDKTLPGLDDFYMAGQWVEPGGGVPTALMSGRQTVQLLCAAAGRPFVAPERR